MSTTLPADPMTVGDIAVRLCVAKRSVRRWLTAGMLPSVLFGGRRIVSRADVERFAATPRRGPGGKAIRPADVREKRRLADRRRAEKKHQNNSVT